MLIFIYYIVFNNNLNFCTLFFFIKAGMILVNKIKVREYQRGNQKWTIQRNWTIFRFMTIVIHIPTGKSKHMNKIKLNENQKYNTVGSVLKSYKQVKSIPLTHMYVLRCNNNIILYDINVKKMLIEVQTISSQQIEYK